MTLAIRAAKTHDHAAIRDLLVVAFDGPVEAELVGRLRADGDVVLETVTTENGAVVGHVLFSRLLVEMGESDFADVALAPLAVAATHRRRGIGAALVDHAHGILRARGEALLVVLGDPSFYGRFGYRHDRAARFASDYQCEALQALAFADAPSGGRLRYATAFAAL